eukprot:COSAG01_NODE_49067_length_375_cov_1.123188_1_plen_114_part_10
MSQGGSYERVQASATQAGLKERATLLLSYEELMTATEAKDETMFPTWLIFFTPVEEWNLEGSGINPLNRSTNGMTGQVKRIVDGSTRKLTAKTNALEEKVDNLSKDIEAIKNAV